MESEGSETIPFRRAWTATATAFLLHNVEEVVLNLPDWSASHPAPPWFSWMQQPGVFAIAVGALSLAVGCCAIYAIATGPSWSRWGLTLLATVMLLNAASHVGLSIMTSTLMPGVITATLVVAPAMLGAIWAAWRRA